MYFHSFSYENWVIPEKIHTHTPTKEGMLENHTGGGGGVTALEIQLGGGFWT